MFGLFKKKLNGERGYSLLELVATLGVLSILTMGTLPIAQNAVKRQKEQRLREVLRQMRSAIDEFKREINDSFVPIRVTQI